MIIVAVSRHEGFIKGFMIKGHAGYRPRGEDIVCAAVSMLAQTTLIGLHKFVGDNLKYVIDDKGEIRCTLSDELTDTQKLQSEAILETMVTGLKNLQSDYSGYIRVFRRRWTS